MFLPRSACHRIAAIQGCNCPASQQRHRGQHQLLTSHTHLPLPPAHDDLVDQALVCAFAGEDASSLLLVPATVKCASATSRHLRPENWIPGKDLLVFRCWERIAPNQTPCCLIHGRGCQGGHCIGRVPHVLAGHKLQGLRLGVDVQRLLQMQRNVCKLSSACQGCAQMVQDVWDDVLHYVAHVDGGIV